ncbi:MAG: glycosyl transferase, partial [Desulfobacterales bacterium]|nr:glycosyl transferase [Desulfobacterales bacterium]
MKIIQYCQHVLGIGHFFRTLEICRALRSHEVVLVTGGAPVDAALPPGVREIRLPGLMMDDDFKNMFSTEPGKTVEEVKEERRELLWEIFEKESPDLLIVELYPFGRKAFRFELDPVLAGIRDGKLPPCAVVCSLRDILVEKRDAASYENRVLKLLNGFFHALLVHADPGLLALNETFSGTDDIAVPLVYTGFVTPRPAPDARTRLRRRLGLGEEEKLVTASAGGGKVGGPLLKAAVRAFENMDGQCHLQVFTGPFMDNETVALLETFSSRRVRVSRFSTDFLSWLAAADLSVSMAGYNTCMNIMAARTPALVWPFAQNREQRLRAGRLARLGGLRILEDEDLAPARLASLMTRTLSKKEPPGAGVDLNGA